MGNYRHILFDLDGTLSDPKIGITKSIQYALKNLGIIENNLDNLEHFIGPPLAPSLKEYYHFNDEETRLAIHYYRERFKAKGMYENQLYPEIPGLLHRLKDEGYTLNVATSKATVFAEEILKYFKINHFFDYIAGANLDGTRVKKFEIIQNILNLYEAKLESFIMIGDRKYDIIGAHQAEIDSIGVTYGYGSIEELNKEKPTYTADNIETIGQILTLK